MKEILPDFIVYAKGRNYSKAHENKLICGAKKILKYTHFFDYRDLYKVKNNLDQDDIYKAIKIICHYLVDKNLGEETDNIRRIRKMFKKPKAGVDLYTPSDKELINTLTYLKEKNYAVYELFLGLVLSGVRVVEMNTFLANQDKYRIIQEEGFIKVSMNASRNTKNVLYLYLPNWYKPKTKKFVTYANRLLNKEKGILRPKYIRKWFYSKCIDLAIPNTIGDFYQGRQPITIGNRHYLNREKLADKYYKDKLMPYFESMLK